MAPPPPVQHHVAYSGFANWFPAMKLPCLHFSVRATSLRIYWHGPAIVVGGEEEIVQWLIEKWFPWMYFNLDKLHGNCSIPCRAKYSIQFPISHIPPKGQVMANRYVVERSSFIEWKWGISEFNCCNTITCQIDSHTVTLPVKLETSQKVITIQVATWRWQGRGVVAGKGINRF